MLCQSCGKSQATTHVKSIVNGELKEFMLCSECAKKMGYGSLFHGFGFNLGSFLGSFLGEEGAPEQTMNTVRCKRCGSSFNEIAKTGQVGCAECYRTFYDRMIPSIQRIHGNTTHVGKLASSAGMQARLKNELEKAKEELKRAIQEQEFEKAAQLRDRIKEIERQGDRHE
ncbi:MAG: hypothetical protein HFE39_04955 [Clostridiales bacterium]|jgi:protein arginine kinase activator|nr:hypothetical protein [Clostridiales bacterium]